MRFQIHCHLTYDIVGPASFLFNVAAAQNACQTLISEGLNVSGADSCEELALGCQRLHRVFAKNGGLQLAYEAVVDIKPDILKPQGLNIPLLHEVASEALVFLYPSRFCQSDLLARFARREFDPIESGFEKVTRICNWIYEYVEYLPGLTNSSTSAFDTATQRAGVCRDYAHLGIALCRSLGIPARFVSSYAYGLTPADFHAHFEAFLGGRWIIFDPSRLSPQSSFIRIGQGRDAADTSFATIFGNAVMRDMNISTQLADQNAEAPQFSEQAISNYPSE
jgi:transglutaminase-like putative cysteine protease